MLEVELGQLEGSCTLPGIGGVTDGAVFHQEIGRSQNIQDGLSSLQGVS